MDLDTKTLEKEWAEKQRLGEDKAYMPGYEGSVKCKDQQSSYAQDNDYDDA